MSKITALILCIVFFLIVQVVTWFQLNGQFVWPWFKNNVFLLCLIAEITRSISLLLRLLMPLIIVLTFDIFFAPFLFNIY